MKIYGLVKLLPAEACMLHVNLIVSDLLHENKNFISYYGYVKRMGEEVSEVYQ